MQKPSLDQLKALSPESPDELILSFQEGLPKRYFRVFKEDDYKKHLQTSEKLTKEIPFQILVTPLQNQQLACTIISYNYPSTFMSITGILGSMGFDIREGHVFTFKETQVPQDQKKRTPFLIRRKLPPPKRTPLILDYFVGQLDTVMSLENWVRELHQHFKTVFHDLDSGKTEDLENARRYINQLVADRLRQLHTTTPPVLYPMTLSTLQRKLATRITIVSQNTPFFLYSWPPHSHLMASPSIKSASKHRAAASKMSSTSETPPINPSPTQKHSTDLNCLLSSPNNSPIF